MASFLKSIFKKKNDFILDNTEDIQGKKKEKWNICQKNILNIQSLFDIDDENFIINELTKIKTILEIKDEKEFVYLFNMFQKKKFTNTKLIEILRIIEQVFNFKKSIDDKENDINRIFSRNKLEYEVKDVQRQQEQKEISIKEGTIKRFGFRFSQYFFKENSFKDFIFSNTTNRIISYFNYLDYLIKNVFVEDCIKEHFSDFCVKYNKNDINHNKFNEENIIFIFNNIFLQVNKENYFNIFYDLFIALEKIEGNKDDKKFAQKISSCILYLLPNKYNFKTLLKNNYFKYEYNLNFLFSNKNLDYILKKQNMIIEKDIINTFLNFLIYFEKYVNLNETKKNKQLLDTEEKMPNFFKVKNLILEIILKGKTSNIEILNSLIIDKEDDMYNFVFLKYILCLYEFFKKFNRDYSCKELINIENNYYNNEKFENDKNIEEKEMREVLKNNSQEKIFNLENFIFNDISNCIYDKVLIKEISTTEVIEQNDKSGLVIKLIEDIFEVIYKKNNFIEILDKLCKSDNQISELIDNNYIYKEKIKKLPFVIFLKIIHKNTPIIMIEKFMQNFINSTIDKNEKKYVLKFFCFTLIEKSLELLSEKSSDYVILQERLELINKFFVIEKIILNTKIKIIFLDIINEHNNNKSNKDFTLKQLIFEEEKLKDYFMDHYKDKLNNSNSIISKIFLNNGEIKKLKIFSMIYDYISMISNKFNNSKGLKFYELNQKEIININLYLNSVNQFLSSMKITEKRANINILDFVIFFIKQENLEKFSLELLINNVKLKYHIININVIL